MVIPAGSIGSIGGIGGIGSIGGTTSGSSNYYRSSIIGSVIQPEGSSTDPTCTVPPPPPPSPPPPPLLAGLYEVLEAISSSVQVLDASVSAV